MTTQKLFEKVSSVPEPTHKFSRLAVEFARNLKPGESAEFRWTVRYKNAENARDGLTRLFKISQIIVKVMQRGDKVFIQKLPEI